MAKTYVGQENGKWVAKLDMENGSGVQVFEGANEQEVIEKLLAAQANASQKIREMTDTARQNLKPVPEEKPTTAAPKQLSADDRYRLTQDLTDPTKAPEAIKALLEAQVGVPVERIRENANKDDIKDAENKARTAAKEFSDENSEYYACPENSTLMGNYLNVNNYSWLHKVNYQIAYDALRQRGLLISKPAASTEEGANGEEERIAQESRTTTRPRGGSSGLRNTNGSTSTPSSSTVKQFSRTDIEKMPADEYAERYKDPNFRKQVDTLYGPRQAAR